jgi:PHD/YefM family antitoxin component YafN of YafNO toxin-antitoxin module
MTPRIATTTRVERDELLDFVRPRHRMVLITRRREGSTTRAGS